MHLIFTSLLLALLLRTPALFAVSLDRPDKELGDAENKFMEAFKTGSIPQIEGALRSPNLKLNVYYSGISPLAIALAFKNKDLVQKFLDAGARMDFLSTAGVNTSGTPLTVACLGKKNADMVRFLVDKGARLDGRAVGTVMSPMTAAFKVKDLAVLEILLSKGANPNTLNQASQNPLLLDAIASRQQPVIDLLLKYKANPNDVDQAGSTALVLAEQRGDKKLTAQLKKLGGKAKLTATELEQTSRFKEQKACADVNPDKLAALKARLQTDFAANCKMPPVDCNVVAKGCDKPAYVSEALLQHLDINESDYKISGALCGKWSIEALVPCGSGVFIPKLRLNCILGANGATCS